MIDIGKILKRSWHILWNFRVLWIFGVLLAITAGGNAASNGGSGNNGYRFNGSNGYTGIPSTNPTIQQFNNWFQQNLEPLAVHPEQHIATFVWIGVAIFLFIMVVGLLFGLVRYPSETAVIRMVDEYEKTGTKTGFRAGWKLGWNRRAFRMWLIDLIICLPVIVFSLVVGALGLMVYLRASNGHDPSVIVLAILAGLAFLFILVFGLLMLFLVLLRPFIIRAAALDDASVRASFRLGWQMVRHNWKSAGLMWLVMLGLSIACALVMTVVFFLLIPVYIVTGVAGAVVAAIPGLIAFGIASLFVHGVLAIVIAVLVALPFLLVLLFSPLVLIGGWVHIFSSSAWTLAYREMKALETPSAAPVVALVEGA